MTRKAVCLLSGGLDSCVTSYVAKNLGYKIYALSFTYGQRHSRELESAKKIAASIPVEKHIIFDINLSQFGGSTLLDSSKESIPNHPIEEIGKDIPPTYVPARNTIFLSIALAYAETIDAETIFIGVNATDYSGYPDCRPEYIKAYQNMANLATKKTVEGHPIKIETPLISLSKADIIRRGVELEAPFHLTWSCYRGKDKACGRCDSCILRLKGFKEAGIRDPIPYETYPDWYNL